ncbi:MAG: glycosyltransferase, partial [Bacteroidota bacterium]
DGSRRILVVDDQIPDYRLGSGYQRTYRIVELMADMGNRLTYFPLQNPRLIPDIAHALQSRGIEVLYNKGDRKIDFGDFMRSRAGYYDMIFVSRPHNMSEVKGVLAGLKGQATIVYDAEALFSLREIKFKELSGEGVSESEKESLIRNEVSLVRDADLVATVSPVEKGFFEKYGARSVHILGHVIEAAPTPASFAQRDGILFVGGVLGSPSPNQDALMYFVNEIFPLVRRQIDCDFFIVGTNRVRAVWDLESEHVHVVGSVDDLTPYYNRCRLFVVPTRYSAGIPLKLIEASAHGLPAVVTPLTAFQLGWEDGRDVLVGQDAEDFARKVVQLYSSPELFESLCRNALERVGAEYSPERFQGDLDRILQLLKDGPAD